MSACPPDCTCRGTNGMLIRDTPCYDEAVLRALDLITVAGDVIERAASKVRHPSNPRWPSWMQQP